jgi:hypothetical protein
MKMKTTENSKSESHREMLIKGPSVTMVGYSSSQFNKDMQSPPAPREALIIGKSATMLGYSSFQFRKDMQSPPAPNPTRKKRKRKRGHLGRTPKLDWPGTIRPFIFALLNENGWPFVGDPKWASQGDVERAVHDHIQNKLGVPLAESTVRFYTSIYMKEWRKLKR